MNTISLEQSRGFIAQCALPLTVIATLALAFQVGHFFEHFAQFAIWVLGDLSEICGRNTPWMSAWATDMVDSLGAFFAPSAPRARQSMLGLETLHTVGNSIFLVGIGSCYLLTKNKYVRYAFIIEGLHLCEHIMLTGSAFYVGRPIGLSTLFGEAINLLPSKEWVVGYRVSWHFVMNLFPMPLVMLGIMDYRAERAIAR